MKSGIILLMAFMLTPVPLLGQNSEYPATLDVMSLAVDSESLDSIPVKVNVPKSITAHQLTLQSPDGRGGNLLLTGVPYDSVGVRVPADITINNQFDEKAKLGGFQILYGLSDDESLLDVLSPTGCIMIQIPQTGRIQLKIEGKLVSKNDLRGTYTGSVTLNCDRE